MLPKPQEYEVWLEKGKKTLDEESNPLEAVKCFEEAIRLKPDYADAFCYKGIAFNALEKSHEAIPFFDTAIRINSNHSMAYNNKGNSFYDLGRKVEAIECYDAAIRLKPDYINAYRNKGTSLEDLGKSIEAIEAYDAAIRQKPDYAIGYNFKGKVLYHLGRNNEAIECYEAAIRFQPDYDSAYKNKGDVFLSLGKLLEAIECYDAAIRANPDYADAYVSKGLALYNLGKKTEAIECYDTAIRLEPDCAKAYMSKGIALSFLGKKAEAVECYDTAIRFDPEWEMNYLNKGNALSDLGKKVDAIECYDAAIRLQPNYVDAYINKGNALSSLGKKVEAMECYDTAIRLRPNYADAYINKANALSDLGKTNEAMKNYDEAIRLKPDYVLAYRSKAGALGSLYRLEEMEEMLKKMIELEPNNPLFYCFHGGVLNLLVREEEALEDLNKAYTLMQEMQKNMAENDAIKNHMPFINEILNEDRVELLEKLTKFQKNSMEFQKELKQLKSDTGDDVQLQKQIEDEYATIKNEKTKIFEKVVDLIDPNKQDGDWQQKILSVVKEMSEFDRRMIEEFEKLKMQVQMQMEQKVNREEIEFHALRVSPEIENNPKLKSYFEALYDRLHSALNEAEVICGGRNIKINTSNVKVLALSKAIELTPVVGNLISNTFSTVANKINENNIRTNAIKLKSVMGTNPSERQNVIKNSAETATLNNRDKIDNIETNLEVEYWINKGFIAKCKDFFTVNVDYMLYQSKPQILGCIDALKIMYAIQNDEVKPNSNSHLTVSQIALVPFSYMFSEGRTISANREQKSCCKIFLINEIKHANPLLNRPELLKTISSVTGFSIYKAIEHSRMLITLGHDLEELDLETLCCLIISFA